MAAESGGNRTKYALDHALRQLLEAKHLDQIRVRELTELCVIRRQSFYYHFVDVYELFEWSLQQEKQRLSSRQEAFLTGQQVLIDLLEHIGRQRSYYRALLDKKGRPGLQEVVGAALTQPLEKTRKYYQERCGAQRNPKEEAARQDWEQMILLSLIEGWIRDELPQQSRAFIGVMETVMQQGAIGAAWENMALEYKI